MTQNIDNSYSDHNHNLILKDETEKHLPSTEVRAVFPEFREEFDFKDLIDTIIRRKTTVLTVLVATFLAVTLYTFLVTPQFRAKGVLKVSAQSANLTKFDNLQSSGLKTIEFQQTQVKLLQSNQMTERVINRLDLLNNKYFNENSNDVSEKNSTKSLLSSLKSYIRPETNDLSSSVFGEDAQYNFLMHNVRNSFQKKFRVSPVRNSELIEVSFQSPDPALTANIINAVMGEFVNMHMDGNLQASKAASSFLDKQIRVAQIKLEKSELQLHEFARKIGIVSLSPKLNLVMRQLEELNEALAKAQSERITREAMYLQTVRLGEFELEQVINNELIQDLKNQYASLKAEYKDLSITFKPEYPKMLQLKARMTEIEDRILNEKQRIINSVKNNYETALKKEQYLAIRAEEQKISALNLEERATQYKILQREVETNKSIYQSLLQRSKEIEATIGAAVTNIQIVDRAILPLYPFKPKVAFNLICGIILGLLAGIITAFIFEYFDNTIKSPDEMADKYRIPVLGLIPFDKNVMDDRMSMSMKFYNEPRSPIAEAFRTTMTSVRLSVADNPPKTILITSILPGAGKSSLASNAAFSYLGEDERCLVIDVDLRKPSLHKVFKEGVKGKGLSSVLSGMENLGGVISQTEFEGLDFISSGPLPPNPAELLSSKRMRQLLQVVANRYDRVILDGPPCQGFAEILVLANMVGGVILISVEGNTPREGVKHFRKSITNVGGRILGTIINKTGRKKGYGSYGGYNYYSYNYEYGDEMES